MVQIHARLHNEEALRTVQEVLREQQGGRPVSTTAAIDFALHQTALREAPSYAKKRGAK